MLEADSPSHCCAQAFVVVQRENRVRDHVEAAERVDFYAEANLQNVVADVIRLECVSSEKVCGHGDPVMDLRGTTDDPSHVVEFAGSGRHFDSDIGMRRKDADGPRHHQRPEEAGEPGSQEVLLVSGRKPNAADYRGVRRPIVIVEELVFRSKLDVSDPPGIFCAMVGCQVAIGLSAAEVAIRLFGRRAEVVNAQAVGEYPVDQSLDQIKLAASTSVATTLMNFDEFVMKR